MSRMIFFGGSSFHSITLQSAAISAESKTAAKSMKVVVDQNSEAYHIYIYKYHIYIIGKVIWRWCWSIRWFSRTFRIFDVLHLCCWWGVTKLYWLKWWFKQYFYVRHFILFLIFLGDAEQLLKDDRKRFEMVGGPITIFELDSFRNAKKSVFWWFCLKIVFVFRCLIMFVLLYFYIFFDTFIFTWNN